MQKAVILAAGLSTRLQGVVGEIPKPLVKINNRSMIEYTIENLHKYGFDDVIITLHYKPKMFQELLGNGEKYGVHIEYSYEETLLDTAGSLQLLKSELQDDFFVCGGSFLLQNVDLVDVMKTHKKNKAIATVVLSKCQDERLLPFYGQACVKGGHIIEFFEKPQQIVSNYIHTTYQVFSPQILNEYCIGEKIAIPDLLRKLLMKNSKIGAYITEEQIINISNPLLYQIAQKKLAL